MHGHAGIRNGVPSYVCALIMRFAENANRVGGAAVVELHAFADQSVNHCGRKVYGITENRVTLVSQAAGRPDKHVFGQRIAADACAKPVDFLKMKNDEIKRLDRSKFSAVFPTPVAGFAIHLSFRGKVDQRNAVVQINSLYFFASAGAETKVPSYNRKSPNFGVCIDLFIA